MTPWKKTFISAFAAQILSILGFSFALPFLPFFIADLGVKGPGEQAFWAGVILAAAGITFALSAPLWGIAADRFGRKIMVWRAMFGGTLVLFLMSFVQTISQLVICRLLQGALTGTMAASIALVAGVVPRERSGFTLGMMQTAVYIGAMIGPFFGGLAADALGYRASFRVGALLCLMGGIIIYFGTEEKFTPPTGDHRRVGKGFRKLFMLKGFMIAVIIMFAVRLNNTLLSPSFPLIIKEMLPDAENLNSITGSVLGAAALAGAFSAAILGHVGDKLGHRNILVGCCLAACLSSAGHYWALNINHLLAARILFGLGVAGMLPAANAMIHSIIDHHSIGKAYGLATSMSMAGFAVGPFIGGIVARQAGLRMPFLISAVTQLVLAIVIVFLVPAQSRARA